MEKFKIRFIDKLNQLRKESDLAEIERGLERFKELHKKVSDGSATEEETGEFGELGDVLKSGIADLAFNQISNSVEATIDGLYRAVPKDTSADIIQDIADAIILDIEGGKYNTIQEAIDNVGVDRSGDIQDYLKGFFA